MLVGSEATLGSMVKFLVHPKHGAQMQLARAVVLAATLSLTGALLGCSTEPTGEQADAMAVQALGRLEDPGQIPLIAVSLSSPSSEVRAEAVNALGQAVFTSAGDSVMGILQQHLAEETDSFVLGVLGRTMGRMRYDNPSKVDEAEDALRTLISQGPAPAPLPALTGAVMGLEWLARRNRGRNLGDSTVERLNALTGFGLTSEDDGTHEERARVRRVALMALTASGSLTEEILRGALSDPDPDVRRLALVALPRSDFSQSLTTELSQAQGDPVARVRVQAATALAAIGPMALACPGILAAAADPHPQVAITALDLLAGTCPEAGGMVEGILEAQRILGPAEWHRGAHALLALAGVSPEKASPLLPALLNHENPFARSYAARTATRLGDIEALEILSGDEDGNVRTAAIQGLFRLLGHDADPVILAQLDHDNPELVLTAAGLLEGTPLSAVAVTPLLGAMARMSADGRETYRDPRMGILERLEEVAGPDDSDALEGYLTDFDPVVAQRVAEILNQWTGNAVAADPVPSPRLPLPSPEETEEWTHTRVVLEMEGGGEIQIRLLPYLAPTNAARFVRLARSGYFDGLTFHRVVSNFVLQGGSPHANEMSGDALFTRDEIGLQSHWRGTVGTSTRGRNTGDGQIFINLVDNLRLDHNYTVFGEVVAGMDVVDRVLEGQKILRARVEIR